MAQREVGQLRTRLSWEGDGAQRSMQGFRRDLKGLRSELNETRSRGRQYSQSLEGLRKQQDILNRSVKTQQERVRELKRRYDEARRTKGENAKQTQDLARQYNNAQAQLNRMEGELKDVTRELKQQESTLYRVGTRMETLGTKMQTVGRNMTSFGRTMSMRVTAPLLALGGYALKAGMDFEEGLSRVQAISGATGSDLEALKEQAKELGATTRFSATEAASGMEYLAMAGFETNEILGAMPAVLDLAAAANMDLGRAADVTSNIMSAFNIEAEETSRIADVLAAAASSANTTVDELAGGFQYVGPIANDLGLSIEEMAAAMGRLGDSGIKGQQAGRMLRQGFTRLISPTGEAAKLMEELGINVSDAEGNMLSLPEIIGQLNGAMRDMEADTRSAALSTIFGAESMAGWSVLLNEGEKDLRAYTKELQESEGSASEMAKTMQDNAKGAITEFKSAAEGAGIALAEHMIPTVTRLTEKATELIRKFGELDDEQQEQIIKWGLIAAAAGPAAIVLGSVTTAVGGLLRVGGSLMKLLGVAGGKGLIGRLGLLGRMGPVGLAIAGVSGLGYAIYKLTSDKEKLIDVNFDAIEQMESEIEATQNLADRFDELQEKNKLTTDEMLEYMDILTQIEEARTDEKIAELSKRQEELLEKSGFTNQEMQEFLELNDKIIEQSPNTQKAISEEGNAYAETTEAIRQMNKEQREKLRLETESELLENLQNEKRLYEDLYEAINNRREAQENLNQLNDEERETLHNINRLTKEREDIYKELNVLEQQGLGLGDERYDQLVDELNTTSEQLTNEKLKKQSLEGQISDAEELNDERKTELENIQQQVDDLERLRGKYEQIILANVGINAEKGEGLEAINEEINRQDKLLKQLDNEHRLGEITTNEYRKQKENIQGKIGELRKAKGQLKDIESYSHDINRNLGKGISKSIDLVTSPGVSWLNSELGRTIQKTVNLKTVGAGGGVGGVSAAYRAYADGTNHHPGGPFIAGEEGWELGRLGNRWEMLNFGMYDRPSGYEVFPHHESKRILNALNNLPGYASGARAPGEANRVISSLGDNSEVIYLLREIVQGVKQGQIIQIDGEYAGRTLEPHITEEQRIQQELNNFA